MTGHTRLGDRIAAWRSRRTAPAEQLLPLPPLPLTGDPDRAEALLARGTVWDSADAMTFGWLDDLSALGDERTGRFAARMTEDWVITFGAGRGWTAEATGLRLLRWLAHAHFLHPRGVPVATMEALARQAAFLQRRWRAAPGWAGIAALVGLSAAAHALDRPDLRPAPPPIPPLPRNPEDLTDALVLMIALRETWPGLDIPQLAEAALALRAMRHADTRLTRLAGGTGGDPLRLDAALVAARVQGGLPRQAMGLARLVRGRSTLIADLAPPYAFELTAGRHPIVIATPEARAEMAVIGHPLRRPKTHPAETGALAITAGHDGWRRAGLLHTRDLALSADGTRLTGSERLDPAHRRAGPVEVALTFPLHPEIAALPRHGRILLTLPGGDRWTFTADRAELHGHTITLAQRIERFPARIDWTFAREGDTPRPIRDLPPGA